MRAILCSMAFGVVAAVSATASADTGLMKPDTRILSLPDAALGPYVWTFKGKLKYSDDLLTQRMDAKDPLRLFWLAFRLMRDEAKLGDDLAGARARKILDLLLDEYQPADRSEAGIHWQYGFDYEGIKSGWWSGMDAFFGPLVLYAAWQEYGIERYRDAALKSARLSLQAPPKGGTIWQGQDGCWVSEYTWKDMSRSDEYHVLNGHLFGLQAIYMLGVLSGDSDFSNAYECGVRGTKAMALNFSNARNDWSWYQATPKVVNPPHYLLFEANQHRALRLLTGDEYWQAGFDTRAAMFAGAYSPAVTKTPEGTYRVLLSMLGAPHPYWPDTYPMELKCTAGDVERKSLGRNHYNEKKPYVERFIASVDLPSPPDSCAVSIDVFEDGLTQMTTAKSLPVVSAEPEQLKVAPKLSYNSTGFGANEQEVLVNPIGGSIEGRIELPIDEDMGPTETLALVVTSELKTQLSFLLEDSKGVVSKRDYNDIVAGKPNLVLVNRLGFVGEDKQAKRIKSITLRIHSGANKEQFKFSINDLQMVRNAAQFETLLKSFGEGNFSIQ